MTAYEKIVALIADSKGVDASEIKPESTFKDLQVDSLDIEEMVMEVEDTFGITLELNENVATVADLVALVEAAQ